MSGRRVTDLEGHDAYGLIGVPETATRAEIRRGYRRAMLDAHPDHGGPVGRAQLITCALGLLMDDRAGYDEYRRRQARRRAPDEVGPPFDPEPGGPPERARPAGPTKGRPDQGEDDPWAEADDGVDPPEDDDRPYRPFATGAGAGPRAAGGLSNAPMFLGVAVAATVLIAVLANLGNSPAAPYSSGIPWTPGSYANPTGYAAPLLPAATATPALSDLYARLYAPPSLQVLLVAGHSCRVRPAGRLTCSGANDHGQLGVGDRRAHSGARPVSPGRRWRAVTVGRQHTCAIRQDRSLWCWGANGQGQLGTGKGPHDSTAAQAVRRGWRWRAVAAVRDTTCAVRTSGTLWCWGRPPAGGMPGAREPVRSGLGITWTTVRRSGDRLCATRPAHPDRCWSPA